MNAFIPASVLNSDQQDVSISSKYVPKKLLKGSDLSDGSALFDCPDLGSSRWWQKVHNVGAPLVGANISGEEELVEVTFLFRGAPDTRAVFIDIYSHTPHFTQELTSLVRIGQSDIWFWRTQLPADWCGSYFFVPATAADLPAPCPGPKRRRWWRDLMGRNSQSDDFNPLPAHNSAWGSPLSAIQLKQPVYGVSPSKKPSLGKLHYQRWKSKRLGCERDIWLYDTRESGNTNAAPLVLLLDGHYWARQLLFIAQLEQLTLDGKLPAAQYLFMDAISPPHRSKEMSCNADFWLAIQQELLPQLQLASDSNILIAGQSLGGLSAVYAALKWPECFSRVLSLSGSFWWPDVDEVGDGGLLTQALLAGQYQGLEIDINLAVGCYEPQLIGVNQALREALSVAGIPVSYSEFRGGHDWLCWRDQLLRGLVHMLGRAPTP